jgi:WD40 repeat protein
VPVHSKHPNYRGVRAFQVQRDSFAAQLAQPGRHRNLHSILLIREAIGGRMPHNAMSRLEMKRFSTSANLFGHSDAVYCLAVNSNNTVVLTGSDDLRVKAWSICAAAGVGLISAMRGHQACIDQVMFNPQDEDIAISSDSSFCTVRFWRIANGQQLRLIISHEYNGRDIFFGLQNCMDKYLVSTTRNEIKFWSFAARQERVSLDANGEPELHQPVFGITFPSRDRAENIGIIAMHPFLPYALVATDSGTLYLITMFEHAGPCQYVALKIGKDGKDPLFSNTVKDMNGKATKKLETKEITELSWNPCGTHFVVAGKDWNSNILIVSFKVDAARCFVAASQSKEEGGLNKESAPKRDSGSKSSGAKRVNLDALVNSKNIVRLDLKALDETISGLEKLDEINRSIRFGTRPLSTGCKNITCISWSREGARIIVGCGPTSLIDTKTPISKSTVRVFCSLTSALLVSFDHLHDCPIQSIIAHPSQSDIFMTASYDGDVKICDISSMRFDPFHGSVLAFEDAVHKVPTLPFNINGCKILPTVKGKPQISEARWQRSDTIVVARKSGHFSLISASGFVDPRNGGSVLSLAAAPAPVKKWRCRVWGSISHDQALPEDHFYLFEKRKLKWDQFGTAVDEVTEARTHEMPRGPLCNRHYESYDAFGYDESVWEQALPELNREFVQQQQWQEQDLLIRGAEIDANSDDDILVQPLQVGAGRRVVDISDSDSGES